MVSAIVFGSSGPGQGRCVDSHSASLHPGVSMDTGELNAGDNTAMD